MVDIRNIMQTLGIDLEPINTVQSFVDNSIDPDYKTKANVNIVPLGLFGLRYVIFDSYVYKDVYYTFNPDSASFLIASDFIGDDAGVNMYDVTKIHKRIVSANIWLSSLPCIDNTSELYDSILENYLLSVLQTDDSFIKSMSIEGKYSVTSNIQTGDKNPYFIQADTLSGGCISNSLNSQFKKVPVFYATRSRGCV